MLQRVPFLRIIGVIGLTGILRSGLPVLAQNPVFSQYNYTPLLVNPALAAAQDNAALILNHRSQSYGNNIERKSALLSLLCPLTGKKSGNRWGGIGLSASNDQMNEADAYRHQTVAATFAYNVRFTRTSYLGFGMQGAYSDWRIGTENFTTGSQWLDNYGYDPAASSGEAFGSLNTRYFTLNSGMVWYGLDRNGKQRFYLGVSAFHLNRPVGSFLETGYRLPAKPVVTGGYRIYDNGKISITPEMLFTTGTKTKFMNAGPVIAYAFADADPFNPLQSGSLALAAKYTSSRVLALALQFDQPYFTVGFNYDIPVASQVVSGPGRGAVEFMLALKKPSKREKKKQTLVKDYSIGQVRNFYQKEQVSQNEENTARPIPGDSTQTAATDPAIAGDFQFELKKDFKFGFNESALNPEAETYLDDLATLLQNNPDLKLKVIGHTDNVGTAKSNQQVALARAAAVESYLIRKGISPKRIKKDSKGDNEPIYPNDSEVNRAKNRRVEFIIYRN